MKKIGVLLLFILVLIACDKSNNKGVLGMIGSANEAYAEDIEMDMEPMVQYKKTPSQKKTSQKIIKTSYLAFETTSVEKTFQNIQNQIKKHNGFIQSDNTSKDYNRINRSLIVRIPTQKFQLVIDSISARVKTFDSKQISLKDVTEEFVDLGARLKAKKALEARYLQLLAKAKNVKEMLEIEREIATIREEIEAKQGRLNYLQNQVSFSTINLEFYEYTVVIKSKSKSYFSKLVRAFKGGFDTLGNFILGLLYIWPFVIILGIGAFYIRKRIKNKKNKRNEKI